MPQVLLTAITLIYEVIGLVKMSVGAVYHILESHFSLQREI